MTSAPASGATETTPVRRSPGRAGALCAIGGSGLVVAGSWLHPMSADPSDAVAAFAEYAADSWWVASHLTQLAGAALIVAALLVLGHQLETEGGVTWARLGRAGAIASLATAATLQAVDGIALKALVDTWAAAPPEQKAMAFHAALAVRHVEIGLASVASLLFGLTASLYGVALLGSLSYPTWTGGLGIAAGMGTAIAGVVMAHTGFSGLAMAASMPASVLVLVWMVTLGVFMWRGTEVPSR